MHTNFELGARSAAAVLARPVTSHREEPVCSSGECTAGHCPILLRAGTPKTFAKGDVVFWEGDESERCYLILSGVVRGTKLLDDGRRMVCRFAFPGSVVEYSTEPTATYTAETITPVRAISLSRSMIERSARQTNCLANLMTRVVLEELSETRAQLLMVGRLSASERVVQFLRQVAAHLGTDQDGAFTLPMTRQNIADFLGLTIETVSRAFSRLKSTGQIRLLGTTRVAIRQARSPIAGTVPSTAAGMEMHAS